jgi:predicted amidohydrolase
MDLGWCAPASSANADEIPGGETCQKLARAAQELGIWVCSGVVEHDAGHIYNSAVLIDPSGRFVLHHRKIHELDIGRVVYQTGTTVDVCATPFGVCGLMICADAFIEDRVISRSLGQKGADFILSPCAWAVPPAHNNSKTPYGALWLDAYAPVCREFGVWIAGCSNVGFCEDGAWTGWKYIGNSIVMDPTGTPALIGPHGENAEDVLLLDVELTNRPRPIKSSP